jgi:NADH-quinone oxidoreductase subunit L
MEGPTPVSALIHAATMVAAGVYMLARVSFLIEPSLTAQAVIATIGAVTCLFAALMATQQDDIKRILAYSTLSQLGYMILAVGVAAPGAAMFHLFTHACFKALLFLGAGAIIHQLHHEQGIWKMGGLRHRMRWTFYAFTAGYLALTGCPGLSGSFSKDEILFAAYNKSLWFFLPAVFTVFLTAFYMTRLYVVVFFGKERSDAAKHGHDGPPAMTAPLWILAFFAVFAGYGTADYFLGDHEPTHHLIVEILAIGFFLSGTGFAWFLYRGREKEFISIPLFKNKFYIDEIYAALIAGTQDLLAVTSAWFDKWILDGLIVRGLSSTTWGAGFVLRFLQVGNLQAYALLFGLGVIGLIYLVVFTK